MVCMYAFSARLVTLATHKKTDDDDDDGDGGS